MIEADWPQVYPGRLLRTDLHSMSAREFEALLRGLLSTDSRLSRHFTQKSDGGRASPA